jgi:hypothetical protein
MRTRGPLPCIVAIRRVGPVGGNSGRATGDVQQGYENRGRRMKTGAHFLIHDFDRFLEELHQK